MTYNMIYDPDSLHLVNCHDCCFLLASKASQFAHLIRSLCSKCSSQSWSLKHEEYTVGAGTRYVGGGGFKFWILEPPWLSMPGLLNMIMTMTVSQKSKQAEEDHWFDLMLPWAHTWSPTSFWHLHHHQQQQQQHQHDSCANGLGKELDGNSGACHLTQ